jgi:hypothetical protein
MSVMIRGQRACAVALVDDEDTGILCEAHEQLLVLCRHLDHGKQVHGHILDRLKQHKQHRMPYTRQNDVC